MQNLNILLSVISDGEKCLPEDDYGDGEFDFDDEFDYDYDVDYDDHDYDHSYDYFDDFDGFDEEDEDIYDTVRYLVDSSMVSSYCVVLRFSWHLILMRKFLLVKIQLLIRFATYVKLMNSENTKSYLC